MSRIGKAPIALANGVETTINGQAIEVKGPKGTLNVEIPAPITAVVEDNEIRVVRPDDHRENRALHGLSRSLINNAVVGVTEGFTIKMEIFGVGYRVAQKGKDLEFALGYSHPILIEAPEGITFATDGTTKLSISGIDKQIVGQIAANIRRLRKDDPYKGKGIRYAGARSERRVSKQWQTLKPQSAPQSVRTSPPDVAKHVLVATSASARPCVVPQRLHAWLSTAPPATCTSRSSTTWLATPWLQLPPWKLMCAHWKATRRLRHLRSAH